MGYAPTQDRVLAIGDNIFTDLLGAQTEGYDCLFVADGLYADTQEKLTGLLKEHGIIARYMAPKLNW